jgi:hypothetical protein
VEVLKLLGDDGLNLMTQLINNIVAWSSHAGAHKIQKHQGTRLHNSSGALLRLASPPFPSLRSACC